MPALSDHIENALNESRILLLGGQVLLGFSYRICFEDKFEHITYAAQLCQILSLLIMSAGLCWLIWPAAFHQIAQHGAETEAIHTFTTRVLDWGLFPFAAGIGLSFYCVTVAFQAPDGKLLSIAVTLLALSAWYGGLLRYDRQKRDHSRHQLLAEERKPENQTNLNKRIKDVLIECRMALPGAQAFLGFQFSIIFMDGFNRLPRSSQWVHFLSLVATTISIILLIAPAAYHRLALAGEETEHFHTVASRLLLSSLIFLAPGISGDLLVVFRKVTGSLQLSIALSAGLLIACYALWFGASALRRN